MGRAIGAVVAGFVLWTVLWLGFSMVLQGAMPEVVVPGEPITHTGALLAYIAWSAIISAASGWVCAAIRKESPMKAVWALAIVLLIVGIGVEASAWALTPAWYHVVFLLLLVPATVFGGRARSGGAAGRG